jgi:hypothetical protein
MQQPSPVSVQDRYSSQRFFSRLCFSLLPWYAYSFISLQYPANWPDVVYSRLSKSAIEYFFCKNMLGFTDNKIEVEMSSGPAYPTIKLVVHEFVPSNREFLSLSYVKQGLAGAWQKFAPSYAPPLGLYSTEGSALRNACLRYIMSVTKQDRDGRECTLGDTSTISWNVLSAVNRYQRSITGTEDVVSTLYENSNIG